MGIINMSESNVVNEPVVPKAPVKKKAPVKRAATRVSKPKFDGPIKTIGDFRRSRRK